MTDTLSIAYKILYSLEHRKKADYMGKIVSPEKLGVEPGKWAEVIRSLLDEGYIRGVRFSENIIGETEIDIEEIAITLKGAEYLKTNSTMEKIGRVATNIISIH